MEEFKSRQAMSNIICNKTKPRTRSTLQLDVLHCLKVYKMNEEDVSQYFKVYKTNKENYFFYPYLNKFLEDKKQKKNPKTNIE